MTETREFAHVLPSARVRIVLTAGIIALVGGYGWLSRTDVGMQVLSPLNGTVEALFRARQDDEFTVF
ncbi:hypothetical protein [Arthrobacter sp. AQ5-05]|uniref:hypothetical protein n=1 Tax=Arthrobacter sp. AQ5-05 TaxID=2184581 RepID=UPI0012B53C3D|nr:hypothetical protein [Arthrobacter sp. AQ5-05]